MTLLADEYVSGYLEANPVLATIFAADSPHFDDRWDDNSPEALARWNAKTDSLLARIREIDPAILVGRAEGITYGVLRELLETSVAKRVCHEELWFTRSDLGLSMLVGGLCAAQPVDSPAAKRATLARWKDLARYLDLEVVNLNRGLEAGYFGEKGNVRRLVAQMDELLTPPIEKTPLYDPAQRAKDPEFGRALAAVIAKDVRPALQRYRDFLEKTYLSRAREQVSVEATPGGAACYLAFLREGTSLPLGPEEVHRVGLEQLQRIEDEMRVIARRSFQTEDLPALLHRLTTDKAFLFKDGEELSRCARDSVQRAKAAAPRVFGLRPQADLEVRDNNQGGSYQPSPGPGRPAIFWISLASPETEPRLECETTAFHEGIPGHHLQLAIALERGAKVHPISRYFFINAFGEGWALYSERVADELGLFSDDLHRLGMLSAQAFRAARLVVDTGLHAKGWSRERAVEYMLVHTSQTRAGVEQEVDRYIGFPGQATGYMIGALEIRRLRDEAQTKLGPRFDLRQFHDRILEDGHITLPMVRAKVERWIAAPSP